MRYTINVNTTLNGKTCKNPQVEFIIGEDILLACEIEDGKITFELPEGADPNTCIEGYIKCEDDCLNCPPQYFKVCLCNDVTQLEPCQICVDGFIKDLCTPEQLAAGKVCTPDGCKCPPTAPIEDPTTGQCVQCITGQTSGCKICVAGMWQDIVCPENEVCNNGDCQCAPGYTRNPFTGVCEPNPQCLDDTDCGPCETCVNGQCKPIQCPPGFQCWNGECIPGCINTNCSNGADCGPNCGCLNGQCVPCAILSCLDPASCQAALGCECQGDKCGPVNNCGQYCDGNTPCLDENCTCYNNQCVSCKNFPCAPDECSDKYNCGCQGGECNGGNGCSDKFELKKNTECSADGCELEAKYTTSHKCLCDPIEFKISNVYTQPTEETQTGGDGTRTTTSGKILEFNTRIFKNNIPYENFRSIATMGDDELVDATITTKITHKVDGNVVTPTVAQVNPVSVDGNNKITNITINNTHVAKTHNGKGTVVTIEVRAENVKVNSNGCTSYNSKVIATYELDYRSASTISATNNRINTTFQNEISTKVQDKDSTRKPLFVWFKSNTGTFGLNKYQNNGTYNQNGFFRKQYGVKGSDGWYDKINNPAKNNTGNQPHELWNNLNYRATVDCGCGGGSGSTLQNVIFCCTENIDYTIQNCGKRITVPPFSVCSVNKNLTSLSGTGYIIPQEAQTFFWMIINGTKEVLLRQEGGEIINTPFVYDHDTNISSVTFEQRYKGSANTPVSCNIEYAEDYVGPDYTVTQECGKVVVTKLPSSPNIQSVTGKKGSNSFAFTSSNGNTIWTATGGVLSMNGEVEVTVNFQNSCSYTKKVNIVCQPEIKAVPTDTHASGECPGGTNPDVVVSVVAGFSSAVKFSKDGITYVDPDSTSPTIQKTFTNFPAGTHTFYAKEIINGVEVIDTVDVIINPMLKPVLTKNDICGTKSGSINISGAAPGSVWLVLGPGANITLTVGSDGKFPGSAPIRQPGQYLATLLSSPTNNMCTGDLSIDILKSGGVITPQIITEGNSICNGQELFFRIDDGGQNLTYTLNKSSNTVIQDLDGNTISSLQANNTGTYNAKAKSTTEIGAGGNINLYVTGVFDNICWTIEPSQIQKTIPVKAGPRIGTISVSCGICDRNCYSVLVSISGTTTGVTIDGKPAAPIAPGVWSIDNVQSEGPIPIVATNSATGCSDTASVTELPNCYGRDNCPPQTISISANPDSPTCGTQTVSLFYVYSTLGDIDGAEYLWYKTTGGIMQLLASGTISGTTVPQQNVTSSFTNETYALVIRTINGICEYTSNELTVFAQNTLSPEIFGAGIAPDTTTLVTGQTYSYSTGFIPGATYTWTLSNANGSNQPVGTNSNAIQISSFTNGANVIHLTVNDGICTGTASVTLTVGLSCPTIGLSLIGTGNDTCRGIGATVDNTPPGVTLTSYEWQISYDFLTWLPTLQSGTVPLVNFDTVDIIADTTAKVRLVATFSNGCPVISDTLEYTRCACICSSSNACGSSQLYPLATSSFPGTFTRTIGTFDSGDEFEWYLGWIGTSPIQYIFKLDGVTIHDTGKITRLEDNGSCTSGCTSTQFLGDGPASTVIMNPGPTQLTGLTTSLTGDSCDRLVNDSSNGFIRGTGANTITLSSSGLLTVELVVFPSVSNCGNLGSQGTVRLVCV